MAIPAVAVLNWLERRIERLAHEMDSAITRLFTRELPSRPSVEVRDAGAYTRPAAAPGGT